MIRVTVKNFQSIAQSSVEIDGFTVVTGPNNSGKTALMRAIRGVFTNTKGTSFVRHGTDNCEVAVEFADGNAVVWEKGKTANRYTVNGKLLDKVGIGVPDEVEALGVAPITAGNQTIWPQIAPQFTGQVFLLDQPGSVLAEAVADVERVGKLSRALKACDSDKRQVASELKVRRSDQKAALAELATFDGLDTALAEVEGIEQAHAALAATRAEIDDLLALRSRHADATAKVAALNGVSSITVPSPAVTASLVKDSQHLKDLEGLSVRLATALAGRDKYAGADKLSCRDATVPDKSELDELVRMRGRYQKARDTLSKLSSFAAPMFDQTKADKLSKAATTMEALQAQRDKHLADLDALRQHEAKAAQELQVVEADIREILDQLPSCPTCGAGHAGC